MVRRNRGREGLFDGAGRAGKVFLVGTLHVLRPLRPVSETHQRGGREQVFESGLGAGRNPGDCPGTLPASAASRIGVHSVRRMRKTLSVSRPDPGKDEAGGGPVRDIAGSQNIKDIQHGRCLAVSRPLMGVAGAFVFAAQISTFRFRGPD